MLVDQYGNLIQPTESSVNAQNLSRSYLTTQRIIKEKLVDDIDDDAIRVAKQRAHLGAPLDYYRIIDKLILTDAHTAGLLHAMYDRICSHKTIVKARELTNEKSVMYANVMNELLYDKLYELKYSLVEALFWGVSVTEITLVTLKDKFLEARIKEANANATPIDFVFQPLPNLFLYDENGQLAYMQDTTPIVFSDYPDKFIVAIKPSDVRYLLKKPIPFDEIGLHKQVLRPVVDKIYAYLARRKFDDLFSDPVLNLSYEDDKQAESDAKVIYDAYANGGRFRTIRHTAKLKVEFLSANDSTVSANMKERIEQCNAEIAKAINGDNLGIENSSNRASSVQGFNKMIQRDKAVVRWIDSLLNKHIIPLLMKENFGEDFTFLPYAETIIEVEKDKDAELDVLRTFFDYGGTMMRKEFDERLGYETPKQFEAQVLASPNRILPESPLELTDESNSQT